MKLMVVEHVLGSLTGPTNANLQLALQGELPKGALCWYITEADFIRVQRGLGGVDLRAITADAYEYMGALLLWQVLNYRPDAVLLIAGHTYAQAIPKIRELGIPVHLWAIDDPHELNLSLAVGALCDTVFTTEPVAVKRHKNCRLLQHAVVTEDVAAIREAARNTRHPRPHLLFSGSLYPDRVDWLNAMVDTLVRRPDLDVRCIASDQHPMYECLHPYWKGRVTAPVSWNDLQFLYAISEFTINIQRGVNTSPLGSNLDVTQAEGVNQALFSVPALGGRLLCDASRKKGIEKVLSGAPAGICETPEEMARMVVDDRRYDPTEAREVVLARHDWKTDRLPILWKGLEVGGMGRGLSGAVT